jgi:hypothetical protein
MEQFVNKVAESGIITLDLATYIPMDDECAGFDLKPYLFREMILREKDFRAALPLTDWQQYGGKYVALFCSADAIVPVWAYMLIVSFLQPIAASVYFGTPQELKKSIINSRIYAIDATEYAGKRVVIKGCGDVAIPEMAYAAITFHLRGVVKSLMYGEPCSTVPIYKRMEPPKQ